jgi:uncharacterized protein (DUF2236 family)
MMIGGTRALLLQMLHPAALAGVWDHSVYSDDLLKRLRRTARFVVTTTYGDEQEARSALRQVRAVHRRIRGSLADGTAYSADDPDLLDWVHATGVTSFLAAWLRYAEPGMTAADQDLYLTEMAIAARALGAGRPPRTRCEAHARIGELRPNLRVTPRTHIVAEAVLRPGQLPLFCRPIHQLVRLSAIDLLPGWARELHGLEGATGSTTLVRMVTLSLTRMMPATWRF